MSKHALQGVMKNLALELSQYDIRVNSITPGFIDTKLTRNNLSKEDIVKLETRIPLKRLGNVKDISNMALYLCSEKASYLTGQDITIDGGFIAGGFLRTTSEYNFLIDGSDFNVDLNNSNTMCISSSPRDYKVTFTDNVVSKIDLNNKKYSDYIFIADKNIMRIYPNLRDTLNSYPTYIIEAVEDNKNIHEALRICDFLLDNNANRGTCIYGLGGGIIQDLVAYAAATFKRGIPLEIYPHNFIRSK